MNGQTGDIVAAQTAGGKAAQFLCVPLESIGTAMTTYASQNMGAKDLDRVDRGVYTALGIGCVYSIASFLILRVTDKLLIGLFLDASETAIMANAQSFIFWNSVFYIPLAVLSIYRYTIQGLGFPGLAMFAGVAEMIARAMVGFWFVPLWGYFAACIASPVAWFFACFFLIPAYFVVRKRLQKEKDVEKEHDARRKAAKMFRKLSTQGSFLPVWASRPRAGSFLREQRRVCRHSNRVPACVSPAKAGNGNSLFPPLAAVVAVAEPTVPPLCLRTGPHFPDIRWRNSQPLVSGNFIRCYCRSVI